MAANCPASKRGGGPVDVDGDHRPADRFEKDEE